MWSTIHAVLGFILACSHVQAQTPSGVGSFIAKGLGESPTPNSSLSSSVPTGPNRAFFVTNSSIASTGSSASTSSAASTSTPVLGSTGSGDAYASACDALWASYENASEAYGKTVFSTVIDVYTQNYTLTSYSTSYTCETTCGTICYAGTATTYSTSYWSTYGVYTESYEAAASYPSPTPTCSVALSDCVNLWAEYSTSWNSWYDELSATITPSPPVPSPTEPVCNTCAAAGCTIDPGAMDLYYWPVTANVSRDMCASNPVGGPATAPPDFPNTTYTPVTTGPSAIVNGHTFYSGNVYLSVFTISATDGCGSTLGQVHTGDILAVASTDLFTMRGYPKNDIPYSVSWADFNTPIPYSAYFGMPACNLAWPPCSVVFDNEYLPQFVMPAAIRQLDPAWASCSLGFFGLQDPPTALQAVTLLDPDQSTSSSASQTPANPQTDVDPGTTSAQPGQTPQSPPHSTAQVTPPPPPNNPGDPGRPSQPGAPPRPGKTPNPPTTRPPTVTVGSSTVMISPGPSGGVVVNTGTTISSGVPATISGTTLSIGPSGVIIGSPSGTKTIPLGDVPFTITAGSETLTVQPSNSAIVEPGTTLHNGDPALTISGTTISVGTTAATFLGPSGTQIVPFADPSATITIGSQAFTEDSTGGLVIAPGTTLHSGDVFTLSSTTVSMDGTSVVLMSPSGTQTIIMPAADPTETDSPLGYDGAGASIGPNKLMLGVLAWLAVLFSAK